MGNEEIIYGDSHGASFDGVTSDDKRKTHWDRKLEINGFAHQVTIGIIPPDEEKSTDDGPIYNRDEGQFMQLSRSGCNRLIRAVRKYRDQVYEKDE